MSSHHLVPEHQISVIVESNSNGKKRHDPAPLRPTITITITITQKPSPFSLFPIRNFPFADFVLTDAGATVKPGLSIHIILATKSAIFKDMEWENILEVQVMGKRLPYSVILSGVVLFLMVVPAGSAQAGHHYGDDIPEHLYYIEGTGSYFLPQDDGDIFFNLGRWYRHSGDSWFTSDDLDGPWTGIIETSLPKDLADLPPDFRTTRHLGLIPSRHVVGEKEKCDGPIYLYYRERCRDDYMRHGYGRHWFPHGGFWYFMAPCLDEEGWEDIHRCR